ncbi:MAG: hypothetical protein ABIS47_06535 [Acidimicrobiales bacterium]
MGAPGGEAADPDRGRRPWGAAVAFGLVAGLLVGLALVALIAAPLYLWAQATEPGLGLQRPLVRSGLRAAPLAGLVASGVTSLAAAGWRLRRNPGI